MEIAHCELQSEEAQAFSGADAVGGALLIALVMVSSISLGFSVLGGDEEGCKLTELESYELGRAEKLLWPHRAITSGKRSQRSERKRRPHWYHSSFKTSSQVL